MAAVAALVKGSATPPIGTLLTTLFWNLAERGTALWWIEYVQTKSNHAYRPSMECDAPNGSRCSLTTGNCHPTFYRAFKSRDAFRKEETMVQQMKNELVNLLAFLL